MNTEGPRSPIPFHASEGGKKWLDGLAKKYRVSRSAVIRHAMVVARRHEPEVIKRIEEEQ
jgi:hypothetical protein